ncbi:MAG: hypothetical protein FJ146_03735 [Deltaproteobacteria bacterium]|nr:hypothetical protein [Deltaproteobacteria bacterium]
MNWLPFITAAVVIGLGYLLYTWQRQRQVSGAQAYRKRFLQVVTQLETVTKGVTDIGNSLQTLQVRLGTRYPSWIKLFDYYEATLALCETVLIATRKLEPFGTSPSALDSVLFLIRDLRERVGRLELVVRQMIGGELPDLGILQVQADGPLTSVVKGCYFCSRPVIADKQTEVRVRLDGQLRQVHGCKVCRDELTSTRKVKVLHFMIEGQPVHWSQVNDYRPNEDFWSINQEQSDVTKRHLVLVTSHTEAGPVE